MRSRNIPLNGNNLDLVGVIIFGVIVLDNAVLRCADE
jgi:hypothetical protein